MHDSQLTRSLKQEEEQRKRQEVRVTITCYIVGRVHAYYINMSIVCSLHLAHAWQPADVAFEAGRAEEEGRRRAVQEAGGVCDHSLNIIGIRHRQLAQPQEPADVAFEAGREEEEGRGRREAQEADTGGVQSLRAPNTSHGA